MEEQVANLAADLFRAEKVRCQVCEKSVGAFIHDKNLTFMFEFVVCEDCYKIKKKF